MKFTDSNEAQVGIVVTILLMGLFVTVIATIQVVYVPKWMEDKEAEHMDVVANQFQQLKSIMDLQSTIGPRINSSIQLSTPITLGSKELPYFVSARAFGSVEILENECVVNINTTSFNKTYSLRDIRYSSRNAYFMDQSYIYECGSLILNQSEGNTMIADPQFDFNNETVVLSLINISIGGGKSSMSGYGTYQIQTKFLGNKSNSSKGVSSVNINITTDYPTAWIGYFEYVNSISDYNITAKNNTGYINVTIKKKDEENFNLEVQYIEIEVQIGPGEIV